MRASIRFGFLFVDGRFVAVSRRLVQVALQAYSQRNGRSAQNSGGEIPPALARRILDAQLELAIQHLDSQLREMCA